MAGLILPIACVEDLTDPATGEWGTVVPPPGALLPEGAATSVFAGGRLVATVGTGVATHGNPDNPDAPGFNPGCATAILSGFHSAPNVLVEGRPVAVAGPEMGGTLASCTHYVFGPGCPTVLVGGVL
jgi:hypothetical protein